MTVRSVRLVFIGILTLAVLFAGVYCDKKTSTGNDGDKEHASWFPPEIDLSYAYRIFDTPFSSWDGTAKIIGYDSEKFPGETYVKVQIGNFTETVSRGVILWLDLSTIDKVGYKAAEVYYGGVGKTAPYPVPAGSANGTWDIYEFYTTPLWVEYRSKVGDTYTSQTNAVFYYNGDMENGDAMVVSAEWTFAADDASVTVPYGTVDNCILMQGDFTITDDWGTYTFDGSYYLRPDLGVVKATTVPGFEHAELISGNVGKALLDLVF